MNRASREITRAAVKHVIALTLVAWRSVATLLRVQVLNVLTVIRRQAHQDQPSKNADMALYEAKAAGRNTYAFFHSALSQKARQRLEMEFALREAIIGGQLSLH